MDRRRSSTERTSSTSSVAQPQSSWTEGSNFADSAVDVNATTAASLKNSDHGHGDDRAELSVSPISQSLEDRMRRLAAAAWALEQDDEMSEEKRRRITEKVEGLEAILVEDEAPRPLLETTKSSSVFSSQREFFTQEPASQAETEEWVDESELHQVHDDLASVIASLHLRQQEQRHLHQLTAIKLEAIAQKCLFQEHQLQDALKEARDLRDENNSLGQENDSLRDNLAELESEAAKKEVAVSAMTSAVAGLEGWIDDAHKASVDEEIILTPTRGNQRRRAVVRGKGRFRGRYYVDEDGDQHSVASPDARDIQDGVKAWIRGFKDVEDACSGSPITGRAKELYRGRVDGDEDDWGEFESPTNPAR